MGSWLQLPTNPPFPAFPPSHPVYDGGSREYQAPYMEMAQDFTNSKSGACQQVQKIQSCSQSKACDDAAVVAWGQ
eukprot:354625-Pelagomonas_calceolata.AAC.1